MSTTSKDLSWCTNLSEKDCEVGRALAGGYFPSLPKAIVGHMQLQELVFELLVGEIDAPFVSTVQSSIIVAKIPVSNYCNFDWKTCVDKLATKAPRLLCRVWEILHATATITITNMSAVLTTPELLWQLQ